MKRIIALTILITMILSVVPCCAKSPTDKQIVKNYCTQHYPNMKIKYFTKWNDKVMCNRAGKGVVYVEVEKSISSGKKDSRNGRCWGYVKGQHYYKTWYNKKVKRGKAVTSYYIYDPCTNYDDGIVAVIDNKKIR